jgi:hypothetical protein
VARRRAADRRSRGGERVPASRTRTRVAIGAASIAVAAAVVGYALLEAERATLPSAALGAVALAALAAGLAVGPSVVPAGIAGLGACWAVSAWSRGGVPGGTIVAASAIFVSAELAFCSLDQVAARDEGELLARRLAGVAFLAVGALTLSAVLLAALGLRAGGGLVLEAVGVAAAVGVVGLVFALARDERQTER